MLNLTGCPAAMDQESNAILAAIIDRAWNGIPLDIPIRENGRIVPIEELERRGMVPTPETAPDGARRTDMSTQEQVDKVINERIRREFAQTAAELNAQQRPKAKAAAPRPKGTARPKAKPKPKPAKAYTPRCWGEALAHIAKRDRVGMAEAGKRAAREYPNLHPARRQ